MQEELVTGFIEEQMYSKTVSRKFKTRRMGRPYENTDKSVETRNLKILSPNVRISIWYRTDVLTELYCFGEQRAAGSIYLFFPPHSLNGSTIQK